MATGTAGGVGDGVIDGKGTEQRELYSFGQNTYGELGLGDTKDRYLPKRVKFAVGKEVVRVTAGNEATAMLTNTGQVYTCGYNASGQCGVGEAVVHVSTLTKISLQVSGSSVFRSRNRPVLVHSANGSEHVCVVTEDGELYTCGCNAMGQLGHGNEEGPFLSPRQVAHLRGYRVVQVACSHHHTAVVTDDDQTWTFGWNVYGQLGHGDVEDRKLPTSVARLKGKSVGSVACGKYHTVASVAAGRILMFGRNGTEQFGSAEHHHSFDSSNGTADVKQVACGYFHTAVLLRDSREVMTFGRNEYGQLGLGHTRFERVPQKVEGLSGKNIVQVACGSYHTVALDADGRVYPFGRNNHGQLGTGTREDSCRPCFVEKLSGKFVRQVAAGFHHTLCLTGPAPIGDRALGALASTKTLSSDLYRLLNNPAGSDVTFEVEGELVHGHRCIVSARCEPLSRMLDGPMKEASSPAAGIGTPIPVPNHTHAAFLAFLEFLYTDKVLALGTDPLDLEWALDLLDVADQYLVHALKRACTDAIMKIVTVENVSSMLANADSRQALSLRHRCLEFMSANFGRLSSTDGWTSLPTTLKAEVRLATER